MKVLFPRAKIKTRIRLISIHRINNSSHYWAHFKRHPSINIVISLVYLHSLKKKQAYSQLLRHGSTQEGEPLLPVCGAL